MSSIGNGVFGTILWFCLEHPGWEISKASSYHQCTARESSQVNSGEASRMIRPNKCSVIVYNFLNVGLIIFSAIKRKVYQLVLLFQVAGRPPSRYRFTAAESLKSESIIFFASFSVVKKGLFWQRSSRTTERCIDVRQYKTVFEHLLNCCKSGLIKVWLTDLKLAFIYELSVKNPQLVQ